jgi:hypothetical protein
MNKYTAFLSDAIASVFLFLAISTVLTRLILLLVGQDTIEVIEAIVCVELVLAAFFWLVGRAFMKRHKAFTESEDTGLTVEGEEE